MSPGLTTAGVIGGVVLLVVLGDVFVTIFNYDGFSFLTACCHRMLWRGMRCLASTLPRRGGDAVLRFGPAALLPAALADWLTVEISACAMVYLPWLAGGLFRLSDQLRPGIGTDHYFSAGDITSLTFGDVIARSGLYRALADLETVIGLARLVSPWRTCSQRWTRWPA
jgi:hypothetical protein